MNFNFYLVASLSVIQNNFAQLVKFAGGQCKASLGKRNSIVRIEIFLKNLPKTYGQGFFPSNPEIYFLKNARVLFSGYFRSKIRLSAIKKSSSAEIIPDSINKNSAKEHEPLLILFFQN
ncbi:hypothetical protein BpHYR1_020608 [Brachionus plicatilis]|uniref:Uncharacterized protein n=1 Tax=Brachionus plicatilis TaxID=10195 RepID=A0A3M7PRE3_BRAPC|nr:hypothetical protein BpHYR1_020608 [Brachionus plicatilis]